MHIEEIIQRINSHHTPNPPASAAELDAFEIREGYRLPDDLRAFHELSDGARLFDSAEPRYVILPLKEIVRVRMAIYGADDDRYGPKSLYAICDVRDGNYLGIELDSRSPRAYQVLDCFHETFPDPAYTSVVAHSFKEFVERALQSNGRLFFL